MSLVSNLRYLGATTCTLALSAAVAEAATMPMGACLLSDLIAGTTTVTSGDKILSDVSYIAVGPDMPDPSQIVVSPITDMDGGFGFRFTGPFLDVDDGSASDALIEFTISVTDPLQEIVGLTLMGNPSVTGGQGIASVTETVLPQESNVSLEISDDEPGGFVGLASTMLSTGYTSLRIQKDILLSAGAGSSAKLSFFDQTFTQQHLAPEPTSAGILCGASLGLLMWRRRRS